MTDFLHSLRQAFLKLVSPYQTRYAFTPTLYVQDHGPVCYTAQLFYNSKNRGVPTELPEELLSSGLSWFWESGRRDPDDVAYNDPNLPDERPKTQLVPENSSVFLDDLRERNSDGYGRWIAVFGVDATVVPTLLNPTGFHDAFEQFLTNELGPIRIIIVQVSDMNYECVFVPHNPTEEVRLLLETWGITPTTVLQTRPYKELHLAQLESIYKLMRSGRSV